MQLAALLLLGFIAGPFTEEMGASQDRLAPPPFPEGRAFVISPRRMPDIADGGNIAAHAHNRRQLANWGGPVEIRGRCASSCVIYTTLPNACIGPKARFGFHTPKGGITSVAVEQVAWYLRGDLREAWRRRWSRSKALIWVPARDMVRLDPALRICGQR